MPTISLESPRTGQTYDVEVDAMPSDGDMEQIVSHFDQQYEQLGRQHPKLLNQTPTETAGVAAFGGLGRVVTNAVSGLAKLAEVGGARNFQRITGFPLGDAFQNLATQADAITAESQRVYPVNPQNEMAATVGEGAAQAATMLAGGGLAKALGAGAQAMATIPGVLGFAQGAGQGIDTAREIGVTSESGQALLGVLFGGIEMATERLGGIGGKEATAALLDVYRKPAAELLKEAVKSVTTEGIEETIAGTAQDILTRAFADEDPNNPGFTKGGVELPTLSPAEAAFWKKRGLEALGGAAGGTVFALAQGATNFTKPIKGSNQPAAPVNEPDAPAGHVGDLTAADVQGAPEPSAPGNESPQTITGSNEQTGSEMPVPPPTANADAGAGGANAASVPIMVTRDMRQQLYDRGMSKEEVDALTPAQAQEMLTPTSTTASTPATAAAAAPAATPGGGVAASSGIEAGAASPSVTAPSLVSTGKPGGALVESVVDFVEASDLEPLLQNEVNADQTRDRASNRASAEQIASIAVAPDPQLLGASPVSSIGAPVVDDVVLAGNGRAAGLLKGYTDDTPGIQRYREAVVQQAASMGRDVSNMKQPVMIRRVQRYVQGDRRSFVVESNPKYAALQEAANNEQQQRQLSQGTTDIFGDARTNQPGRSILASQMARQADAAPANPQAGGEQGAGLKNLDVSGTTAGFLNTEILAEAAALIQRGVTTFAAWSSAMVRKFGEAIREFLAGIWRQVTSPQTNAARNVNLGRPANAAPVSIGAGGFVSGPGIPAETRARFARPDEGERAYETRADVVTQQAALEWLAGRDMETALDDLAKPEIPAGLTGDSRQYAIGQIVQESTSRMLAAKDDFEQARLRVVSNRAARVWQDSRREAARELRYGAIVNAELVPMAPILAAENILIDRGEAVMGKRFADGAKGAARKVQQMLASAEVDITDRVERILATVLGPRLSPRISISDAEKDALLAKDSPKLTALLNALRSKILPGLSWQDVFESLPSQQRERQLALYDRISRHEALKGLTADERLALTNELDKAWQRQRQAVFLRELRKAGALGEKDASDRSKVEKAMPRLLRQINLGVMTSETFREAVAPEYGLRVLTQKEANDLRRQAEEAWNEPPGLLRNRKMGALLESIQTKIGATWAEILNSYWTAAVLSGLRTQTDTFLATSNGFGTNLLQVIGRLARGDWQSAKDVHLAWWQGLAEGALESVRILVKGDYSYTKRFNEDLARALDGETEFRPVPLGEAMLRHGEWWQKAPALVMVMVGRAMTAADHINNTATTRGAVAVARAMHPEIYGRQAGFTTAENEAARAQAKREITGGREPLTTEEKADVNARARELLYAEMRPEDYQAASEIGNMAAYQNDPTGLFGWLYTTLKAGLGRGAAALNELSADQEVNAAIRAAAALAGGALYTATGLRFMRFGFNFGADLTRYVPGTYLADKLGFYGRETSAMQRELLLGKNIVGLGLLVALASWLAGKDDEDEGWHIEGPQHALTPTEKQQRLATGIKPLSFWRRKGGEIETIFYKQWPTMGIIGAVGAMEDERRFKPQVFAERGAAGHMLHALQTGLVSIESVSALRNIGELLGGVQDEAGLMKKLERTAANWAGGFVPNVLKDADAWTDPQVYKPAGVFEQMLAQQPVIRREMTGGRPQLNVFGRPVKLDRAPWSRAVASAEDAPEARVLASLMVRGVSLPTPGTRRLVTQDGRKVTLESLGEETVWQFQRHAGEGFAEYLREFGDTLRGVPADQAQKLIDRAAERIIQRATFKALNP